MCDGSSEKVVPVCTQHFHPALAVQNRIFLLLVLMASVQQMAMYLPWVAMGFHEV
jgi:hypothetical protein